MLQSFKLNGQEESILEDWKNQENPTRESLFGIFRKYNVVPELDLINDFLEKHQPTETEKESPTETPKQKKSNRKKPTLTKAQRDRIINEGLTAQKLFDPFEQNLYTAYIPPIAYQDIKKLNSLQIYEVYQYLCGNLDIESGDTRPLVPKEIADRFGINRPNWYRIIKKMESVDLIRYSERHGRAFVDTVKYHLPHVYKWRQSVEKPLAKYRRLLKEEDGEMA